MNATRRNGILLALVTAVISGFSVFVNSYGVKAFGNATVYTTAKNLIAAVVLLMLVGFGARTGARLTRPTTAKQWLALAAVGIIGGSVPFVLFFEGLARASSPQAAFLHKTLLLWVALLALPLLGEKLQWGHWVAIALLVVGQVGLAGGIASSFGTPELMILIATLLWSVEVIVAKWLLSGVSSWTVAVARMGCGTVVLLAWLAVRGQLGTLLRMSAEQLGWALVTGVLLAGYVATWFAALARAQAVDVTAVLVLAAPITVGLNALANGASLAPHTWWLAMLVSGGAVAMWLGWRSMPGSAEPVRVQQSPSRDGRPR
jgi:drug/metabolite transporter (DMT)-like permease